MYGNICLEILSLPHKTVCHLEKNYVFHFHNKVIVECTIIVDCTLFIWVFRKELHISFTKTTLMGLCDIYHMIYSQPGTYAGVVGGGGGSNTPFGTGKRGIMVICLFIFLNLCLLVCQRSRSCLNRPIHPCTPYIKGKFTQLYWGSKKQRVGVTVWHDGCIQFENTPFEEKNPVHTPFSTSPMRKN